LNSRSSIGLFYPQTAAAAKQFEPVTGDRGPCHPFAWFGRVLCDILVTTLRGEEGPVKTQSLRILSCLFFALLTAAAACGDHTPPAGPPGGGDASLSETPRENFEAEVMALYLSGELVAPTPLYEELLADLALLRDTWGHLSNMVEDARFVPPWAPGQILVKFTEEAIGRIRRGEYADLDSLNSYYHVSSVDTSLLGFIDVALIRFEGRLHPDRMAEIYEPVSSVVRVSPNGLWNNTYNVYPRRLDDRMTYLVRYGWGDCPAGCIDNRFWYFKADEDSVGYVGTYLYRAEPEPEWWKEARVAFDCYPDCPTLP
jgi:hypothetical protein